MTTDEAPEVWRVECEGGVRDVEVWRQSWGSGMWCAFLPGSGNGTAPLPSPRAAVAQMAGRQGWPVVAVLAPGQPTCAEVDAAHVRAANARDQLRLRVEELEAERDAFHAAARELFAAEAQSEAAVWTPASLPSVAQCKAVHEATKRVEAARGALLALVSSTEATK